MSQSTAIAALDAQVNYILSRLNKISTAAGKIRQDAGGTGVTGVIQTHPHLGTSGGGLLGVGALFAAITDPGDAGAIPVAVTGYVPLVTVAGNETRTLATPTFIGQELVLYLKTNDGTDCAVTCATTVNQTGNTVITFANIGEACRLFAVEQDASLRWRMATVDGAVLS